MFFVVKLVILFLLLAASCNDIVLHDIVLGDDAFDSELPFHIETWYFEAIFDGNESIVFMLTAAGKEKAMLLMAGVSYYEDGELKYEYRKIYFQPFVSNNTPYIEADGMEMMKGEERNGKLFFTIKYFTKSFAFSLNFENKSKGWKSDEWLAVPNMKVYGSIFLGKEEKKVSGKGYHDHNIFFLRNPFLKRGYMDGKVILANISIVWAKLMDNLLMHEDFVIFSRESYVMLKNASVRCSGYKFDHGKIIPTAFHVIAHNNNISIDVVIKAKTIHFIRLPLLHYWRYHFVVRGWIEEKGEKKEIKSYDIGEYMLFT